MQNPQLVVIQVEPQNFVQIQKDVWRDFGEAVMIQIQVVEASESPERVPGE